MTTAYQVSTPLWTCLVVVNKASGRICDTAPLLWRRWLGQTWSLFQRQMEQAWGKRLRVTTLPG